MYRFTVVGTSVILAYSGHSGVILSWSSLAKDGCCLLDVVVDRCSLAIIGPNG